MGSITPAARLSCAMAAHEASRLGSVELEPEHLLIGLCKADLLCDPPADLVRDLSPEQTTTLRTEAADFIRRMAGPGVDLAALRRQLRSLCAARRGAAGAFSGHRSQRSREVFAEAETLGGGSITLSSLMLGLLARPSPAIERLLASQPGAGARIRDALEERPAADARVKIPPALLPFGRSLTQLAIDGKLHATLGRDDEIKQVARILLQAKKSNPMLVGDPGVGKTAIVEGLALRLLDDDLPGSLRGRHVFELALGQLVAGTGHRGDFEARVSSIIAAAEADPSLVLFVDEVHMLLGAGGSGGAMDAANLLKPALARRAISMIAATTTTEYRRYVEKDPALERRFQVVWVDEPSRDETVSLLRSLCPGFERHHRVSIAPGAAEKAVDLAIRFLPDLRLPDKAIDVLDQACAHAALPTVMFTQKEGAASAHAVRQVGGTEVAAVVAERCRIPADRVTADEGQRLLGMEAALKQRVMGQDHAVHAVADAIRTARAGLKHPNRPVGVFLFLGPTGTGKTELAKALAEFLFDDEARLIRIDMSEYGDRSASLRLIGAPPGYVGHEEGGQLTDAVRTHPYSVVLFDEIEKAHPQIFDLFLQIFDDGRLTDSRGRRADFRETVIILTSNLGSDAAATLPHPIGFAGAGAVAPLEAENALERAAGDDDLQAREIIRGAFRPELLNRIQRVVRFHPLEAPDVRRIIDKTIRGLEARLGDREVRLALSEGAYAVLMRHGFDQGMGARQMERTIDHLIVQPLGRLLLEGRVPPGATVRCEAEGDRLRLAVG